MQVLERLAAVLELRVVAVHVGGHGPGPVQSDQRSHVVEARRGQGAQRLAHGRTLELEDAHRVGPAQHLERGLVRQVDGVDVGSLPCRLLDPVERPFDHREVAEPEEVHLQQAQLLDAVHFVLRDDGGVLGGATGVGLALDGQIVGQRVPGDDHRGGMDPVLAAQALEAQRDVDDLLGLGVGLVHGAELARTGEAVLVALRLGEARLERRVPAHDERGHGLGDLVPHDVGLAEDPRRVAHGGPRFDRRERDDLRHPVAAVLLGGVAHDVGPVPLVEVHVDVGHLLAARVEETLEEEVVADRVEVDDPQAVRHAAPGRRSPPWSHPDAVLAGKADEVPHDEKVSGEAHVADDRELEVQAFGDLNRQRVPVPLARALHRRGRAGRRAPGPRRWHR